MKVSKVDPAYGKIQIFEKVIYGGSKWLISRLLIIGNIWPLLIMHRTLHSFLFIEQFYKNIEAQIWSEIFPKTKKNLKYDYGKFRPREAF